MKQYFCPPAPYFVGDCIPFFHNGVYHLFYLLDENHHQGLGGLGGHQWAHSTTTDLVHWQDHPLAIAIDAEWEKSICTGSVFHHNGIYYAYYATRLADGNERLSLATSGDGFHFTKQLPNPFMTPPAGYGRRDFRDPFVFYSNADHRVHMLVSSSLEANNKYGRGGCLAHFITTDMQTWHIADPFIVPGYSGVPECPDYFEWNGWYYLIIGIHGAARYRMSRQPFGPWITPKIDTFDAPMARVMKTAPFGSLRRIGAAFLSSLKDNRDDGDWLYAGNVVFHEIIQRADGALWSRGVPEMMPPMTDMTHLKAALTPQVEITSAGIVFDAQESYEEVELPTVPKQAHIHLSYKCTVAPQRFGFAVRGTSSYHERYEVSFYPSEQRLSVRGSRTSRFNIPGAYEMHGVSGLETGVEIDLVLHNDIVDISINQQRRMVLRLPELHGDRMYVFCHSGLVTCQLN